jgi:hypothetical protein
MGMVCKYDSNLATSGKCKKYFSLPTSTRKKIIYSYNLILIAVYAKQPIDLQVCEDGFGALDSNHLKNPNFSISIVMSQTEVSISTFVPGLYRCGKELKSLKAGQTCETYLDCPTNIANTYASCGCTYSDIMKKCDILPSNYEYQEFINAVTL